MKNNWAYTKVHGKPVCYIYKATSPSGKVYIGYTSRKLKYRIKAHKTDAERGSQLPFHKAIRKYGNKIKFEIVNIYYTKELAIEMEINFIEKFKSSDSRYGYNVHDRKYNLVNRIPTEQERKETSIRTKKMWEERREELVKTLTKANKNNKITEETLQASVVANSKAVIDSRGCIYYSIAEAAKYNGVSVPAIRAAVNMGYTPKGIKYSMYNGGDFFFKVRYTNFIKCKENNKLYKSATEVVRDLKLKNALSVNRACRKERPQYSGYTFDYVIKAV